jgi:hypothetical protein
VGRGGWKKTVCSCRYYMGWRSSVDALLCVCEVKAQCAGVRLQLRAPECQGQALCTNFGTTCQVKEDTASFAKRPISFQTTSTKCHEFTRFKDRPARLALPSYPTTQPYAAAIVSAPCRDQPCLITATSAPFTVDATDSAHNTLPLRPISPIGACPSIPRESGYDHFNI